MSKILIADIKKIDRQIGRCLSKISKIPDGMEVSLQDLDLIDEHHRGSMDHLGRVSQYIHQGNMNDGMMQSAIGAAEQSRSHMKSIYDITSAIDMQDVQRSYAMREKEKAATNQPVDEQEPEGMAATNTQDGSWETTTPPHPQEEKLLHSESLRESLSNMMGGLRTSLDSLRGGLEKMSPYEAEDNHEGFGAIFSFIGKFFKIIGEILMFVYQMVLFLIKMVALLTKFSIWLIGTLIKSFFKTPVSAMLLGAFLYYVSSAVIEYLTGSGPSWIPAAGAAAILMTFMLVEMQRVMKSLQDTILDLTMYLFTNPISRYILGINKNTKFITEKNKAKAIGHFIQFLITNLFQVILFMVLLAILVKFAIVDIAAALVAAIRKKFLA